ncbi:MAG: S8 family serine peptidase [Planctomycetes bacterium]|nr:S8 family serine peptidase [Planctomycetota bacterium]
MKQHILINALILLSIAGFAWADNLPGLGFYYSSENDSASYKQGELIVRFTDVDAASQLTEGPLLMGPLTTKAVKGAISDFILAGSAVEKEYGEVSPGLAVLKLPEGTTVAEAFIKFNESANVLYAEPNYKYKLLVVPNDPMFGDLWGFENTGQTGGTEDADIDAPEGWDFETGDSGFIVAIADTGIDYTHPDLANNMWVNNAELRGAPDVDDDNNGYVDDIYGYDFAGDIASDPGDADSDPIDKHFHGTHIAGVVGAVGNNNVGVTGVCWDVKLMAVKVFADDYRIEPEVFTSDAVEAIQYAVDNGAKVINASWGGNFFAQSLYDAIRAAGEAGVLFVAAAGNDFGSNNDEVPIYPASFDLDNIVSVMSSDPNDQMSDFSNFGPTSVDIAEPGTDILSTTPTTQNFAMLVFGVPTNYATLSGTSLSAPYASGACALIWSQYPTLAHSTVKGILLKAVDPIFTSPRLNLSGGRINLHKVLTLVPQGKAGKVLNSKDDPMDPSNLYPTIQDAIDDANDGDVLIAEANSLFLEIIDFKGKAITLRSGDITNPDDPSISPEDTLILGILNEDSVVTFVNNEGPDSVLQGFTISWGSADYGGGIRCDRASPTITDCILSNNFANFYGAGIDCVESSPTIKNCTIINNRTSSISGIGGGINCELSSPTITDCIISNNFANNVGGGIACYDSDPAIINCVIVNNSAIHLGGGIDLEYSSPTITNCTIVVDDPNAPKDGGIFAHHDSSPVISNCILWGNGDDLYKSSATYSNIEDNDRGIGNIHLDPLFTTGPLGNYYLNQTAAGQPGIDSPCVDAGDPDTDINLQIDSYTTRTDGVTDAGIIDIGAHFTALPAELFQLDVTVVDANEPVEPNLAKGRVEPDSGAYRQYELVQLRAYPDPGYRIKAWTGTNDDSSTKPINTVTMVADAVVTIEFEEVPLYQLRTEIVGGHGTISPYHRRGQYYPGGSVVTLIAAPDQTYIVDRWGGTDDDGSWSNTNTVTMDSDKDVTILFRQPKSLHVPGQYPSIGLAINAAYSHGDKVIVAAGTYVGGFDFQGKAVTVASEHPDDPNSVAETIIQTFGNPAFIFQSGEGHESVVDGFTIQGIGDLLGPVGPPGAGGIGENGAAALGGAITCLNGSSPTLSHLIIRDVVARGQDGEDASFIFPAPDPAPDPLDPLDPVDPLPPPLPPDPNDPNQWAPADPNRPEQPTDPNAPVDGLPGLDGEPGAPGEPGANGFDGGPGFSGGNAGVGYGGAMYFDENSSPIIQFCKIINCQAIGGDGGFGGLGGDGQDGQDAQPGQPGQDGQEGGEGLNDGAQGAGGNGGVGGDGGVGGNGGRGGDGGIGGDGGEALGGAIYFGPNCKPKIRFCEILNCTTLQGLGNFGGDAGNGGNAGAGAAGDDGGGGGDGEPAGADGAAGVSGGGGTGGDGGNGSNMGVNGIRSWAGAIYFEEGCEVEITDTIISDNVAENIVPTYTYGGGDGGDGGIGGDPDGDATGGDGGIGGNGGAGGPGVPDPNDPNSTGPGSAGIGGDGGAGGAAGAGGLDGFVMTSFTPSFGGANYYEIDCKVEITDSTISNNATMQQDGTGQDGGGEYYESGCEVLLNHSQYIGNLTGSNGSGGGQYFEDLCSIEINDSNYVDNSSTWDGGGLFMLSDCTLKISDSDFIGNSTTGEFGSGGGLYGGGIWDFNSGLWINGSEIAIDNSYFSNNDAAFGGGLYWHGEGTEVSILDSVIINNVAEHGGGMFWSSGAPVITGCSVMGNRARTRVSKPDPLDFFGIINSEKPFGGGGGLFCWSSEAQIENCFITGNSTEGSGGGVYFGGDPSVPILKNCLVKSNTAVLDGGGIISYWLTTPLISNCTIVNNRADDPTNIKHGRGGGLSCSYQSQTTLINSILWDNVGTNGNQISIGSDDEPFFIDRPATLTVSYSDIQGGQSSDAIYIEPGRVLNWLEGNIDADPLFVASHHSLSQIAAGQDVDSPCVDAGSDTVTALGLEDFTTRSDGIPDVGQVDIGLHYAVGAAQYELIVNTVGENGTVEPSGGTFDRFTVVKLHATVDPGYRVKWVGTDDDSSVALNNTVTMDSNKTITVEFVEYLGRTVTVPGNYESIQEAIHDSKDGDTIVLDPGTYYGGYQGVFLVVDRAITIMSKNPDDPNSVATTIINGYNDNTGLSDWSNIGMVITPNVDSRTVINGITFQYCGGHISDGGDGDRQGGHPDGFDGGSFGGAALHIQNGASPIIKNCIIIDNSLEGGNGGDGENATQQAENAGRGGWGGWVKGGAIWCGPDSSPQFINCIIENNAAVGGNGGDGGDGDDSGAGEANYGGNWSRSQVIAYDPFSLASGFVPGHLWEFLNWDDAAQWGDIYSEPNLTSFFGDYRWYSAYGGGAYCDIGSNVSFVNCQIRGNSTRGGMSGIGGVMATGDRLLEPLVSYQLPNFGGGVYCAVDSVVTFTDCTFENNISSVLEVGITDPNHRLDPYNGYGGGVCAEDSASVVFVDCNFVDNEADSGGAIYTDSTDVTIVDCNIASNTAIRGGGFVGSDGLINIISSEITNNRAISDINDVNDPNETIVVANGAGLYCWLGGINIQDCNISGNIADYSGGGIYLRDVNAATLINNLIINNGAGRDGGGVSANWYTNSIISNCTFVGNATSGIFGEPNNTGFGGGFYNSYESQSVITDSIFWNNYALQGNGISLGSGFEFNQTCGTLSISYSGIKDGRSGIWVDEGCTVNWGDGNIEEDPLFVEGPLGNYYLSQISSGQGQDSPYVDAGSDYASYVDMLGRTTRTDEISDAGRVDIGYHHPGAEPCRLCDLVLDGVINFRDFAVLADRWLDDTCSEGNNWCNGADLTSDKYVDMRDIAFLADCWLVEDTVAPEPNPSEWETEPNVSSASSITMTAETAIDAWGWYVEYYFESISDGGHDSGWQTSPTYTDGGLTPGVLYGYRVKTRDAIGNETEWSVARFAGFDSIPPAPAPYIETIFAASETSITMTSSIAVDENGVEYYFESTSDGGHDSGWQVDPNYTDVDLDPNTEYSYRVKARDQSDFLNETGWSGTVTVRTLVSADLIPPDPDPMTWDPTQDPNGFDGTPREVAIDTDGDGVIGTFEYSAQMTATVAVDAGGGPVEYFFECTTDSGFSSGWQASEIYIVLVGRSGQGHRFRVKARDQFRNETAWSTEEAADPP